MKQLEYLEGRKATENFEQGMKALFKVPKAAIMRKNNRKQSKGTTSRKTKRSDKD